MAETDLGELLTVQEVAELLKLNPQTVRNRIDAGELPALRIGRRVRIQRSTLEELIGWQRKPISNDSSAAAEPPSELDMAAVASALDEIAAGVQKLAAAVRGASLDLR